MTMRYPEEKMDFNLLEMIQKDIEKINKSKNVETKDGKVHRIPYTEDDIGALLEYQTQILAIQADFLCELLVELTKLNKKI